MRKGEGKIRDDSRLTVIEGSRDQSSELSEKMSQTLLSLVTPSCNLKDLRSMMEREDYYTLLNAVGIEAICENIIAGVSPIAICENIGVKTTNFLKWIKDDPERQSLYDEAKKASATNMRHSALYACTVMPEDEMAFKQQKLFVDTILKVAGAIDPVSANTNSKDLLKVYMEFGFEKNKKRTEEEET